jgi:hypothetical protein
MFILEAMPYLCPQKGVLSLSLFFSFSLMFFEKGIILYYLT